MSAILPARAVPASVTDTTYYPLFDWLRGICACVVMWTHGNVLPWSHAGGFAVDVFFALSGWLIGGILLQTKPQDLPRFYFNRAVRIWAPYYLACAILLTLSVLREPVTAKWLEIVAYKLTFVYNLFGTRQLAEFHDAMPQKATLTHVWSVNTEEQFYLMAPLLLVIGARYAGRSVAAWMAICAAMYFTNSGAIALGVLSALVVNRFGPVHLEPRIRLGLALTLLGCVIWIVAGRTYEVIAPVAALCIVLLAAVPGQRHGVLGEIIGGMSYPLYLNHWIGLFAASLVVKHLTALNALPLAILQAAINISIATALYWWIDKRLLAKRSRWFTPGRGRAVTAMAYAMVAAGLVFGWALL